ncbi:AAA family ATPase [Deinococcus lacus]|uniref:AAA family ATPase n=1 Tax=Deinococcus lacus TaxID=392561 RepID=A0ABW1YDG3_9DEIO
MSNLIPLLTRPEPVTFPELAAELRPFLPLLTDLPNTPQDPQWHAEGDVAAHTTLVLEQAHRLTDGLDEFDRAALLLAAALHDIGKALTTREEVGDDGQTRLRSRQHARRGRDYLSYRLLDTGLAPALVLTVLNLVAHHHSLHRATESERGVWALAHRVPLPLLVRLAKADARGRVVRTDDGARGEDTADYLELMARDLGVWDVSDPYTDFRAQIAAMLPDSPPELLALAVGKGLNDWEAGIIHTPHEAVARVQDAARNGFPRLTVLCGPSGSGKSTLAQSIPDADIISLDALRAEYGKNASDQTVNGQVLQAARERLREALRRKRHAVWDATSLRRSQRAQVLGLGHDYGALTELRVLWTPPGGLGARLAGRGRQVGAGVVASQLKLLEFPEVGEGHELVWEIE